MYIFGASGHAKVIVDILRLSGVDISGFFDDDPLKKELMSIPVLGPIDNFDPELGIAFVAIGDNLSRKILANRIRATYGKAVHLQAIFSDNSDIAAGTAVMAAAVVNADTSVGQHCIINTAASVDHDCFIEDYVHIAPHATLCGGVKVGEGTLIGAGAAILPNIAVGNWVTVGAGAVVISDVPDYAVVVGNPARIIKIEKPK